MATLREELLALTAQFRTHLQHRGRSGALGVSVRPLPASEQHAAELARSEQASPSAASAAPKPGHKEDTPSSVPSPMTALEPPAAAKLQVVRDELGDCTRCGLSRGRRNIVFGVGDPEADLVFVGEAPGYDEDRVGEPFVGKAGQLLTRMIEAMGYTRETVYICNVIKCRPPQNRNPEPEEVAQCEPFLVQQLGVLRPRIIVALGKFAAQSLCGETMPISRLRGTFRAYQGIPVMPTFHPAYLLRNPPSKRQAWDDLKEVLAKLESMGITPPGGAPVR